MTAGAKVQALTALDFLLNPASVNQAWDYFNNVQTKDIKYEPLIAPTDALRRSRSGAAWCPVSTQSVVGRAMGCAAELMEADAWGAVLKLRRRWRRVAADPLEPSLGAHHAPSMARDGPAQHAATAA